MGNRKSAGAISSEEVRSCILKVLSDSVMGGLFAQHTIWQALEDYTLIREPVEFYEVARDPKNWKRKSRVQKVFQSAAALRQGWRRIYVCRPLENLKPRFEVCIDLDSTENTVYEVALIWWPRGAPEHSPSKKIIDKSEAFPERL